MAAKDPFSSVPPIPPSADHSLAPGAPQQNDLVDEAKNLNKGSAPRNLLKNVQMIGVPLLAVGIFVWVLMPSEPNTNQRAIPETETTVDQSLQVNNTGAMLDQLQAQADKTPESAPADEHLKPGSPGKGEVGANSMPLGSAPNPFGSQGGAQGSGQANQGTHDEAAAAAALLAQKRDEDRRASPLVSTGEFKLVDEQGVQSPKSSAATLQDDMARLAAQQNAATASLTQDTRDTLAALSRQPTASLSKNSNAEFLNSHSGERPSAVTTAQAALHPYMIFEGTFIRAALMPDVSSDMPGRITAQVTSDVWDSNQREVLIPKGSRLIGVYNNEVAVGQERSLIAMTRLILRDGRSIALGGASASDMMGKSGLKAEVNNHFWKMFSSSFIIGASSFFLGDSKTTVQTNSNGAGNTTTGSVAGMAMNDAIQTLMNRNKNIPPTLSNAAGTEFIFMVQQDIALAPYRSR